MKQFLQPSKQKQQQQQQQGQVVEQQLAAKVRETEELQKSYQRQIAALEEDVQKARLVVQSLVMVARLLPDQFVALVEQEQDNWSVAELKNIARALKSRLTEIKGKDSKPSTIQRLYSYLMDDPKASKTGLVQVIGELNDEVAREEKLLRVPSEIQVRVDSPENEPAEEKEREDEGEYQVVGEASDPGVFEDELEES